MQANNTRASARHHQDELDVINSERSVRSHSHGESRWTKNNAHRKQNDHPLGVAVTL